MSSTVIINKEREEEVEVGVEQQLIKKNINYVLGHRQILWIQNSEF